MWHTADRDHLVQQGDGKSTRLRRGSAGHLEVQPRPVAGVVEEFYESRYHEKARPDRLDRIARDADYWRCVWTARLEFLQSALPDGPRKRLLDVGCGGGHFLASARESGFEVQGVEPSIAAAAHARSEFGLPVVRSTLDRFSFEAPFDIVHCTMVLEHVTDPEAFAQGLISCVRPGGVLFVEVPNDFNALQDAAATQLAVPQWWVVPDHHLNYFDFDSLSQLFELRGVAEIDRLAGFPMEMFLLMGVDYIRDRTRGRECHQMRARFERNLIESGRADTHFSIQRAFAQAGIGRTCQLLFRVGGA